jgi:AcrR family transcriptional regulator
MTAPATKRRSQEARRRETREKLLDAAERVLIKRGYANFRIAEVAAVSGISHGGMIYHFPSKDLLVAAVLEHVFARLLQRTEAEVRGAADVETVLLAIVDSGKRFFFGPDFMIYLDLVLAARQGGTLPQTARILARRQRQSIEDFWVSSLTALGVEEPDARNVVGLIWTTLRGFGIRAVGSGEIGDHGRIIDFTLELALRFLDGKGGARVSRAERA